MDKAPLEVTEAGKRTFNKYKNKWPSVSNKDVDRVAKRLSQVLPETESGWEVVTFDLSPANAFALPGGKVGINTGVLPHAKSDAYIATILSHEIAHVIKNHHDERDRRDYALTLLATLPESTSEEITRKEKIRENLLEGLPNNIEMEIEADRVGLIYMAKAGYHPREAIRFWEEFSIYKKAQKLHSEKYLKTHPLDSTRISKLNEILPYALTEYKKSPFRNNTL